MTQTRSKCVTVTLLLLAVSLAYGGYSVVRGSRTAPETTVGSVDPTSTLRPATTATGSQSQIASASSSAAGSLSATEAQALDLQLKAIEDELESLSVPDDSGEAAIEGGLD